MNLYKRCSCGDSCRCAFWYRFRLFGREHRGSTRSANRQQAGRIAGRRYNDALEGKAARRSTIKLSALIRTYLKHVEKEHRTANKAARVLPAFQACVGDRRAADVSAFQIEKWKLARAQEVGQSTVNRELNVVKGLFRRGVEWKLLPTSPAAGVRKYRTDDVRVRVLSATEIKTVLSGTPADIALLCRATLECLPRLSELLTLRREHIGPSWIEIRRKGGRVERVAITPELRTALLQRAHRKGFIFGQGAAGEPPTQEATSLRITRVMRGLGLRGISHHTMRHTGVTLMLEAGVNPRVIQKLAGWTTLRMLERYGHARDAEAQRAVTTMHALLQTAIDQPAAEQPSAAEQIQTRAHTRAQS
jgi:integrase